MPSQAFDYPSLVHDDDLLIRLARNVFSLFRSLTTSLANPSKCLRDFLSDYGVILCLTSSLIVFVLCIHPKPKSGSDSRPGIVNILLSRLSFSKWWGARAIRTGWNRLSVRKIFMPGSPIDPTVTDRESVESNQRVLSIPYIVPTRLLCRVGVFVYSSMWMFYCVLGLFYLSDLVLFLDWRATDSSNSIGFLLCPESEQQKKYELNPYLTLLCFLCVLRSLRIVIEVLMQALLTGGNVLRLEPISMTPQMEGLPRPHEIEMCVRFSIDLIFWWGFCWVGIEGLVFCLSAWECACCVCWCGSRALGLLLLKDPPLEHSNKTIESEKTLADIIVKISTTIETICRKANDVGTLALMGIWLILYGKQAAGDSWGYEIIVRAVSAGSCGTLRSYWVVVLVFGKGMFDVYGDRLFRSRTRERKKMESLLKKLQSHQRSVGRKNGGADLKKDN